MNQQPQLIYEFGPFRLDAAEHLLLREGESVPLTPKAFDLLLALVERHGHLVEKDELLKKVLGYTPITTDGHTKIFSIIAAREI
jgi:DNA-binding winged helix-turn-helix (wHTH) protein